MYYINIICDYTLKTEQLGRTTSEKLLSTVQL